MRTRTWPWFLLDAVLLVAGYLLHAGIPKSMVLDAAAFAFLGGCIHQVGVMVRDNPTSAEMVTRRSIEAGTAAMMAEESSRRRRRHAAARGGNAPDSRPR